MRICFNCPRCLPFPQYRKLFHPGAVLQPVSKILIKLTGVQVLLRPIKVSGAQVERNLADTVSVNTPLYNRVRRNAFDAVRRFRLQFIHIYGRKHGIQFLNKLAGCYKIPDRLNNTHVALPPQNFAVDEIMLFFWSCQHFSAHMPLLLCS